MRRLTWRRITILMCSLASIYLINLTSTSKKERTRNARKIDAQSIIISIPTIAQPVARNTTQLQIGCRRQKGTCRYSAPDEEEGYDDSLNITIPTWENLNKKFSNLLRGGRSKPTNPSHKLVIIMPYRDRRVHLKIFLDHMHPFLQRQNLEYVIYVVELGQEGLFNRAAVSNAGFLEVMKREETPCVMFHDVDILPINDDNIYYCHDMMRHYSVALQIHNFTLYYERHMGGIIAFPPKLFQKINGYSNLFEGWGGEDDDLYKRVINKNISWTRQSERLGRYITLEHDRQPMLVNRRKYLKWSVKRMEIDGLNSIKYTVDAIEERPLFTWILVNITRAFDTLTHIKPIYKPWEPKEVVSSDKRRQ